jgi:hypothetical protein
LNLNAELSADGNVVDENGTPINGSVDKKGDVALKVV